MKKIILNLLIVISCYFFDICTCKSSNYYILSLDSATFSGLLTAEFVSFMEKKSYLIARQLLCIEKRKNKRIAMHELFDMIAGSETGAIIASSLVVPNEDTTSKTKNQYWATKSVSFFKENVDILYHESNMPEEIKSLLTFIFIVFVAVVAFKMAGFYFRKENSSNLKLQKLIKLIKIKKKRSKRLKHQTAAEEQEYHEMLADCKKSFENE